jgi:Ca2+/Na+ antiporter
VTENSSPIRYQSRADLSLSVQVLLIVFVALFILFLWLNFALTQEIESIGREIQEKTEELRAVERQQGALLKEISVVGSQQAMSDQAWALGYLPQTPVYVPIAQPLELATSQATQYGGQVAASASAGGEANQPARTLWDLLSQQDVTIESDTAPQRTASGDR